MPGWVPPTVAIALVILAVSMSVLTFVLVAVMMEMRRRGESLAHEVSELRGDIAPTLAAAKQFAERGVGVARLIEDEAHEVIETTRRLRYDVERGVRRAKQRLADFDAVVEVVQEEVEETALTLGSALHTARSGAGMVGQLRRLVLARRRGG